MIVYNNYLQELEQDKPQEELFKIGRGEKAILINYAPSGFDIETYTQYEKNDKDKVISHFTNMYIWQYQVNNNTYIGRTFEEFNNFIEAIKSTYCIKHRKFLSFIHNMSFEFAFIGRELEERGHKVEVFARNKRKPMKLIIDDSIVFLDSYRITGFSLEILAKNYTTTQKLVGDLDYTIPRNALSTIDETNGLNYVVNDVKILGEFADYYKEKYLSINKLPMTQTMVANFVMEEKIKELKAHKDVFYLMRECYPKSRQQYDYMQLFFTGAYSHGMLCNLFEELGNAFCFDEASQYPWQTMAKYFPMSKFKRLKDLTKAEAFINNYCCLIDVTFTDIKTIYGVTILSKHKTREHINCKWDNGRLYSGTLRAFITEVDLHYLKLHYNITKDNMTIHNLTYAKRGQLPKYFKLTVAELYDKKTQLKGVEGMEAEYAESKQKLNGESYGACAVKLSFKEHYFDNGWKENDKDIDFNKIYYRKNKLPQWAIYITSHAKDTVLSAVYRVCNEIGKEYYYYTDTDSIKTKADDRIIKLFDEINAEIIKNNEAFINELDLKTRYPNTDFSTMGIFDREKDYKRCKFLGAKKYMYETDKGIATTIAGLPKGQFVKWCNLHDYEPFEAFKLGAVSICDSESAKLCAYYEDNETTKTVIDNEGHEVTYTNYSYVSLIPTTFKIKDNKDLKELKDYDQGLNQLAVLYERMKGSREDENL